MEEICFYCNNSMVTEDDKLYCIMKESIVSDDSNCEENTINKE